jgi:hypothetical protein
MVERVPATVLGRGVMSGGEAIACPGGGGGGRGNSHGGLCLCVLGREEAIQDGKSSALYCGAAT